MIVLNDQGDYPLRYDGSDWQVLDHTLPPDPSKPSLITGPPGSSIEFGRDLVYAC